MILTSQKNKHARQFVERKLKIRLTIFFIVMLLLWIVITFEIASDYIPALKAMGSYCGGFVIGAVFARRKKIFWQEETSLVIARMDRVGIFLLVIYITYIVLRHLWLPRWFYGHELTAFSLCLAAGTMTGRVLSMRTQIRRVLKKKNIL